MNNFLVRFAATYNCGAYGSSTYNSSGNCTTTTSGQTSGSLIDTGMSIVLPLALGVVLIISAIILMLRRNKKK